MKRVVRLGPALAVIASLGSIAVPSLTESARANGDTRTIYFYHTHTRESIAATFKVDGRYDPAVLKQLNHFLRDWRNDDETNMDPRLFDTLWEVYRRAGVTEPIQIYSAYRSPETNAMLRRRSRAVAEHSQHMLGKAMDTTIPGFPMEKVREIAMQMQRGGVGWYPYANFVHIDVGGVRSWPRMPYDQLARLFPDGKTVHIASNGQTLPGYEQARQEIADRGGTDVPPAQESGGFFAWLFGGGSGSSAAHEDEEDRRAPAAPAAAPAPVAVAASEPAPQPAAQPQPAPQQLMAYAGAEQPPAGASEAVQALREPNDETRKAEAAAPEASAFGGVLPLPPRRPADLVASAEVPLPPVRPTTLAGYQTAVRFTNADMPAPPLRRTDAIGSLITQTASGVPMIRRSRLPAIITQGVNGPRPRLPNQALAFSGDPIASDVVPRFHVVSGSRAPSVTPPLGLRTAALRAQAALGEPTPLGAPRFIGLRRAAQALSAQHAEADKPAAL